MTIRKIPTTRFRARLVSASSLAPAVRGLTFEREDAPLDYLPGQWVKLYLGEGLDRDYSIASAPDPSQPSRFELAVTRVEGGPGSAALHALEAGADVDVLGPSGFFVREDEHLLANALFIGTGTGVAPLRAMLQDAQLQDARLQDARLQDARLQDAQLQDAQLQDASGPKRTLLFGARHDADLLYADEWRAMERRVPNFRFAPTLSRGSDAWSGRRGWVQAHLRELLAELGTAPHVYICGLSRMVGEVRSLLRGELGLARQQVHSERYD